MFVYEKKLQYPVRIANPNPKLAAVIISQYGGADGELGASLRYLSQRYAMPYAELKGLLTDIGTEELGHLEMIGAIVHQLTRNLSEKDIKTAGFDAYFVDHTTGVYPTAASGFPWSAASMAVKGDVIADLTEDLAADAASRKNSFLKIPVYLNGIASCSRNTPANNDVIDQCIDHLAGKMLWVYVLFDQFPAINAH